MSAILPPMPPTRRYRPALLAVLLAATLAPGCQCSRAPKTPTKAAPQAAPQSSNVAPAKAAAATASAKPPPSLPTPRDELLVARWPGAAVDVLVLAELPLLGVDVVEQRMRAAAAAVGAIKGAAHVWRRSVPGEGRMLVRFDDGVRAKDARAAVASALADGRWREEGALAIAAIGRGQRSVAVVSLDADGGRPDATKAALGPAMPVLRELDGATSISVCGVVRPHKTLGLDPSAMANLGVTFADALAAARTAGRAEDPGADAKERRVARRLAPADAAAARLGDVAVLEGGVGAPGACEALVGRRPATVVAIAGAGLPDRLLAATSGAFRKQLGAAAGPRIRPFFHNVAAMERIVVQRPEGVSTPPPAAFAKLLEEIGRSPGVIDLLAVQGYDGVPRRMSPAAQQGRAWTLWLALESPSAAEVELTAARRVLTRAGWTPRPLPERWDTGLAWLLDVWATNGAVVVAQDPTRLAEPITLLGTMSSGNVSITAQRSGPRRAPWPHAFASLDRQKARQAQVSGADIAALRSLLRASEATALGADEDTRVGMGSGILRQHVRQLPLGKNVSWGGLQIVPGDGDALPRIHRDGRPALWYAQDAASARADEVARDFWRTAGGKIPRSRHRAVFSIVLGDEPFEVKAR